MSTPGQVLRDYREAKRLSCEDFAKQLDIAEATLRSLENGTRKITAERAVDIEARTGDEDFLTRCREAGVEAVPLTRYELRPDLFKSERAAA